MNFKRVGLMIDCSRNAVRTVSTVKKLVDIMSVMGYNTLMLYTEDTYEIKERPYFGYLRGRYSNEEIKDIDKYCRERNIELIPCIQTLAHLNGMIRWKEFEDIVDCNDILLAGEEKTYELIDDMLRTVSETFTTKNIHIGMDEAWMLGMGNYIRKNRYTDPKNIMTEHMKRVSDIAGKYGLKPLIWSDMLFYMNENAANTVIPENITPVYWDYYSIDKSHYDARIKEHKKFGRPFWYAGGLWTWTGFTPHNMYSIRECKAAVSSCGENGVENIFFTMWGDNGAETSLFSVLPSMYSAVCFTKGITDKKQIKQGFKELTGIEFDDFCLLDIPDITNNPDNYDKIVSPDKYMLYNDYFLGIYDSITDGSKNKIYRNTAKSLEKLTRNSEYGYLFKTVQSLCNVLSVKNDLGIRTRQAYKKGDREALRILVDEYIKTEKSIIKFYEDFKTQWHKENKPFGFEVQDMRIGGLIQRTKACIERLNSYIIGDIDCIEELEEKILDPECKKTSVKREISEDSFRVWSKSFAAIV